MSWGRTAGRSGHLEPRRGHHEGGRNKKKPEVQHRQGRLCSAPPPLASDPSCRSFFRRQFKARITATRRAAYPFLQGGQSCRLNTKGSGRLLLVVPPRLAARRDWPCVDEAFPFGEFLRKAAFPQKSLTDAGLPDTLAAHLPISTRMRDCTSMLFDSDRCTHIPSKRPTPHGL